MEACRPATPADVPRLAELVRMATAELSVMKGGAVWQARESRYEPIEPALNDVIGSPDVCVVAGTIDDTIVGYGVARCEPLGNGAVLGVIDDIYVEDEARGVGLGEVMIGDLITWCRHRECIGIDALALPGHRQTKNFFEENGFVARKLVMHRPLREGDPLEAE